MMLGQPETAAEHEAEQRQLERQSAAREMRDAKALAEYRHYVGRSGDALRESARVARLYRLGKGGAAYIRKLAGDT